MKKIFPVLIAVTMVLSITSCEALLGLIRGDATASIKTRLTNFIDILNSDDRSDMYLEMHPESRSYNNAKDEAFWDVFPVDYQTYSLSSDYDIEAGDALDEMVVELYLYYHLTGEQTSDPLTLTFKLNDDEYYIYKIVRNETELYKKIR